MSGEAASYAAAAANRNGIRTGSNSSASIICSTSSSCTTTAAVSAVGVGSIRQATVEGVTRSCCIPGCRSGGFKDGEKLCLFPRAVDRRIAWIERIRASGLVEPTWTPTASTFVCQAHFDKTCFIRSAPNGPLKMIKTTVPSIFNVECSSGTPTATVKTTPGKPTVSIIQTRRAAGITPKPRVMFEADPSPAVRRLRESPAAGHTFKPLIAHATAGTTALTTAGMPTSAATSTEAIVTGTSTLPNGHSPPKTTSVVVIATTPNAAAQTTADHKPSSAKRALPMPSHLSPAKKSQLFVNCVNCAQLEEKLNQKGSAIHELEVSISDLKQELARLDGTRDAATSKIERLKESLKDIYTEHQLTRLIDGSTRGRPWDLETVRRAAKLVLACGRNGYQEILNQGQPFPSLKTLNRLLYKRRYLPSTLDNPDPAIAAELAEDLSNTDPEDDSEGSAEEIEEHIIKGEEGRILKSSRKSRKLRNAIQKANEAAQQAQQAIQASQQSSDATIQTGEEAMLDGVSVDGLNGQLLQLHPVEQQPTNVPHPLVVGHELTTTDDDLPVDGSAMALVPHYGQLSFVQEQTAAAQAITGEVIEDILRAQNLTAAEVKEIRVEGSYITIVKHSDPQQLDAQQHQHHTEVSQGMVMAPATSATLTTTGAALMSQSHHVSAEEAQQLIAHGLIE